MPDNTHFSATKLAPGVWVGWVGRHEASDPMFTADTFTTRAAAVAAARSLTDPDHPRQDRPMDLHFSQACDACIERHIGPALDRVRNDIGRGFCGGCGRTIELRRFSYWFPYPDAE